MIFAFGILGALSDASTSKYRRRFWIVLSTVALVISTLTLAYCQEIAAFFVDLGGAGNGDWDERRKDMVGSINIIPLLSDVYSSLGEMDFNWICYRIFLCFRFRSERIASISSEFIIGCCPSWPVERWKCLAQPHDQRRKHSRLWFWCVSTRACRHEP